MPQTRPNPYVGPRAFQHGETLYGRDREVVELLDLLIAERIVLLYSPSGAGKTSLIQAALIPELEKEGFRVLRVMRVNSEPSLALDTSPMANRYILSLLLSLEEALPEEQQMPLAELAGMKLADYLNRRQRDSGGSDSEVLIFDQFEEILTADPTDREAKEIFFDQVGTALRQRQRWALFAMREEYLAGLDPYLRPLPTRLSTTYRLELLGEEMARLAVRRPACQAGIDFTDAAATKLINDLRRVWIQRPDRRTGEQLGLYVEPVQLQVVCRRLWDRLSLDATQIGAENVGPVEDVDSALEGYYAERVLAIAGETGVRERAIREWFDRRLITEQGIRGQVLQGQEQSGGLENQAIMPLVDAHLVRAEKRRGFTWFELAHDRLIEPVRQNNALWFRENLSALQSQAALWGEKDRSPGLLLRDEALKEAERWADTHQDELTSTEHDFLAACRETRAIAARERRQARRIRRLAIGASIIGAIAFMAFIVATYQFWMASQAKLEALAAQKQAVEAKDSAKLEATNARTAKTHAEERRVEAERLLKVSRSWALAAQAPRQHGLAQHEQGALLARQAYLFNQQGQGDALAHVADVLRTVLSAPYFSHILPGHEGAVWSVAFSPDGNGTRLASGGSDGTIRLWELGTPKAAPTVLRGHEGWVLSVAFSGDGRRLASGGDDGIIRLWELGTPEAKPTILPSHKGAVWSVAFSRDGRRLASGGRDGIIRLWELGTPKAAPTILPSHEGGVRSVAFSGDGRRLASGGDDRTIRLRDLGTPEAKLTVLRGHEGAVWSVAFSPDGNGTRLASGSDDRTIRLWELGTPEAKPTVLRGHEGAVGSVAFSPDGNGRRLASGGRDGTIRLWEPGTPKAAPTVLRGHEGEVLSVAFSGDGRRLASGGNDGTIRLWELGMPKAASTVLRGHEGWVLSVAFSGDGRRLASGGDDRTIRLWELGTPEAAPTVEILADRVCKKVWRNLLWDEWRKFVGAAAPYELTCPNLPVHPSFVAEGQQLAKKGDVKKALAIYTEAQKLDPRLIIPAESWNHLCWYGSLWGYARDVMKACEQAVTLDPENDGWRDSRGIARALTGNIKGAIEDFQAFIAWVEDKEPYSQVRTQRQRWIDELRAGTNPFTPEEIETLWKQ